MDMSSGGREKTEWKHIYVEAETRSEADAAFEARVGRYPYWVTCECCGEDYWADESDTLEEATICNRRASMHRNVEMPLEEYIALPWVLIIRKEVEP
jgi:hypothetical protein